MFRAFINVNGNVASEPVADDYQAEAGEILLADPPTEAALQRAFPAASLRERKARARAQVSAAAEAARKQFITAGSGKAMAYQEKAREALAYLAAAQPDPADYLLLQAEVGSTAADLAGVAQVVAGKYQLFRQIEALIGGAEAAAQKALVGAEDAAAIEAVIAGLDWPKP